MDSNQQNRGCARHVSPLLGSETLSRRRIDNVDKHERSTRGETVTSCRGPFVAVEMLTQATSLFFGLCRDGGFFLPCP